MGVRGFAKLAVLLSMLGLWGCSQGSAPPGATAEQSRGSRTISEEQLAAAMRSKGLSSFVPAVERMGLDAIALVPSKSGAVGTQTRSRLGGTPDLPPGVPWPEYKGEPLSFIAQIDLGEAAASDVGKSLPGKGMLYFFYDAKQEAWGFDPKDKGKCRVLYYDGEVSRLKRTEFPAGLPEEARFKPVGIRFAVEWCFPPSQSLGVERLGMSPEQRSAYADIVEPVEEYGGSHAVHRLLGHPDIIQNEMQTECELVTNGLYCGDAGDATGFNDPRAAELAKKADRWRLLLQVDSEEDAGMMWGDSGRLYFWILKEALAARDFSKVWAILQCY